VRDAFARNFAERGEIGASFCAIVAGAPSSICGAASPIPRAQRRGPRTRS
jgi:hypothetical protein